jgi:hypothetical protein
MAHVAHENEVRARQELARAVQETEQIVRDELGRELRAVATKADEDLRAEQHLRV